jgi:signal transduction histidine kinase
VYTDEIASYDPSVTGGRRWVLLVVDVLICVVLVAFGVSVDAGSDLANGTTLDTWLLPVVVLPILARHRWPVGAAVGLLAGAVISGIPTFDQFRLALVIPAGLLVLFSVAARCELCRAVAGLGFVLAAMVFVGATDRVLVGVGGLAQMVLFSFPLCLISWGAGRAAWSRDRLADQLAVQTELLERQRERTAELAVEVERTRLASDLDMAARVRVREMIELADHVERSSAGDGDGVRRAFAMIERLGRESLNDMRGLLGVLRSDERGSRSPRPTLAEIDALLEEARAGGRLVDLELQGDRRPLPPGIELATYRALQHGLVAVGGDPGDPAIVALRYHPDALELEIRGAPGAGAWAEAALAAARERIIAQGGSFSSDSPAGRRVLRAMLPLPAAR